MSDFRILISREDVEMPFPVRSLSFAPTLGFDSIHLRLKNHSDIMVWCLNFDRELTRPPTSGQSQKLNRMKLIRGHEDITDYPVTFSSEDFRNSVLFGRNSSALTLLRLNLNRRQLEEFRGEGDYHSITSNGEANQRCSVM